MPWFRDFICRIVSRVGGRQDSLVPFLQTGTVLDVTILKAPISIRNREKQRDLAMSQNCRDGPTRVRGQSWNEWLRQYLQLLHSHVKKLLPQHLRPLKRHPCRILPR